jgi:DNA-directed RNA polymerase subunit alpha
MEDKQLSTAEMTDEAIAEDHEEGLKNKPVDDLRLSVRARKCLQKLNIRTIGEITNKTDAELLGCKNFGVTSLNEVKTALTDLGLSLRNLD